MSESLPNVNFPYKPRLNDQAAAMTVQRNLDYLRDQLALFEISQQEITNDTPTDLSGILKGNGITIDVATPNTDYVSVPIIDSVLPSRIRSLSTQPADLNTIQENGWNYANGAANSPPGPESQWYVETIMWGSGGYATQLAYSLAYTYIYRRRQVAGTWQAWEMVAPTPTGLAINDTNLPARLHEQSTYSRDLNNIGNGWFAFDPSTPNRPAAVWGYGICIGLGLASNQRQYAWQYNADGLGWWRRASDGAWGGWQAMEVVDGRPPARLTTSQLADANLATVSGFYNVPPAGGANTPDTATHWFIWVDALNPSFVGQFATALYDNRVYYRRGGTGAWGAWTALGAGGSSGDTSWSNFTGFGNQYGNMGAPWGPCQFRKLAGGLVIFRGLVQTFEPVNGDTITNMPAGYRPGSVTQRWHVGTSAGDCSLDMDSGGGLINQGAPGSGWVSVNEVHYYAEN